MKEKEEQIEKVSYILTSVRVAFRRFNDGKIDIEELDTRLRVATHELVKTAVWSKEEALSFISEYIEDQIERYKEGETYLLSFTSSGSLLQQYEMMYDSLIEEL